MQDLPELTVHALALRHRITGERTESKDSVALARLPERQLADLLQREGGLYLRNYGPGTLATASIRGGSAAHTAVLWNGLPVQSPMLGLTDLSLLPLWMVDDLRIHYGSSGAAWGSGAVGGAISLENRPSGPEGFSGRIWTGWGNFGQQEQQLQARWRTARLHLSTRYLRGRATNDYYFRLQPRLPRQRQQHAAQQREGLMQECHWQVYPNQRISALFWWQAHEREIPPTTVQNRSEAVQQDAAWRSMLQWRRQEGQHVLQAKSAWFEERLHFRDPLSATDALTRFHTLFLESEWLYHPLPGIQLQTGLTHSQTEARAQAYQEPARLARTAVMTTLQARHQRLEVQLQARQEWADIARVPFQPALGISYRILNSGQLQGRLARHYRLPTANDLYWRPGGNLQLRPEQGWGVEGGWDIHLSPGLRWQSTAYHRLIRDWILWSVADGQSLWSANNITRVRSRGLEQRLSWSYALQRGMIRLSLGYDLTRSTNEKNLTRPALAAGQQLHYVPVHQAFAGVLMNWGPWTLEYQHRYTGKVSGINTDIRAFDLGWAMLRHHISRKRWSGSLMLRTDNTWDTTYRIVERRPMPGRWYSGGFLLDLKP